MSVWVRSAVNRTAGWSDSGCCCILAVVRLHRPLLRRSAQRRAASAPPTQPTPSSDYPFGTDTVGRDLLAVLVVGTPLTLRIGLIAGVIGLASVPCSAFVAGYYGGWLDTVLRRVVDIVLTVPACWCWSSSPSRLKGAISVNLMALDRRVAGVDVARRGTSARRC